MTRFTTLAAAASLMMVAAACDKEHTFDASGTFEAEEIIISAEVAGKIQQLSIQEGQTLQAGEVIGFIDSTQLYLKKKQLEAQIEALAARKPNIAVQLSALQEQLKSAQREQLRISNLLKSDAATPKQMDDINSQIDVLKKQIEAQKSTLSIASRGIDKEELPLQVQVEQLNDQLQRCKIVSPANGAILTQYAKAYEMTAPGKPLFKMADLSSLILRAYITGNQLPLVKLNQEVKVLTDNGNGGFKETEGKITWISDKAEFTPKTIQTKEERANLVYAIKVKVVNDGTYKIGMYGEVNFQ